MGSSQKQVLIVGASGLVGTAAVNSFVHAGWSTIGASRRFPELVTGRFTHVALDLQDELACKVFAETYREVTHVVYTAVCELPGLILGWSDPHQIDCNGQMLRHLLEPILENGRIQQVTLLQGTKAYGAAVKPIRVPARESQPRVDHPNFYWLQEDYISLAAEKHGFNYTILRPQLIVGPNHGVAMNLPPIIGVYAAMRQHEGQPFAFPGGADWVWEAADARLVGDACLWAATSESASGETFNLTNGEVFSWRDMWQALAGTLGVPLGEDSPIDIVSYMTGRVELWDEIVEQHSLEQLRLDEILGESHHYTNLCFNYGSDVSPPPTFVSTIKIKQAGFTQTCNTEESFCYWLRDLQRRRIIPTF